MLIFQMMKKSQEGNLHLNNKTVLHYAAENDSTRIFDLLISKGANINVKDIIYTIKIC